MKKLVQQYWVSVVLVVVAGLIIYREFDALVAYNQWRQANAIQNPFFVAMGQWSIRFLLLSLLMSPLYAFTGWRFAVKLRKPLGLIAFSFVSIHAWIHLSAKFTTWENFDLLKRLAQPDFVIWGAMAYVVLLLMALTSIKPTMKLLGRWWKPLHRLVYGAGIAIMVHVMVAASSGKRSAMGGDEALVEYQFYLVTLVVLLVVRVPVIKRGLQAVIPFAPRPRKAKTKRSLSPS